MRFLELFSGSKIMARTFENLGFQTFTIDIDPMTDPDLAVDIFDLAPLDLEAELKPGRNRLTVVWASPDCTRWSYANGADCEFRNANPNPLSEEALNAIQMVKHTLFLIEQLEPTYWFLENPFHGALKNQDFMKNIPFVDVTYCSYDYPFQKKTRIWGKFPPSWIPKTACSHVRHENIQSLSSARARSIIPHALCVDVAFACRMDAGAQLPTLEDFV